MVNWIFLDTKFWAAPLLNKRTECIVRLSYMNEWKNCMLLNLDVIFIRKHENSITAYDWREKKDAKRMCAHQIHITASDSSILAYKQADVLFFFYGDAKKSHVNILQTE